MLYNGGNQWHGFRASSHLICMPVLNHHVLRLISHAAVGPCSKFETATPSMAWALVSLSARRRRRRGGASRKRFRDDIKRRP